LWEIPIDYFLPYLQQSFEEMCVARKGGADDRIKLLGEASTLPGKKYISTAFGVMIERAQDNVCPPVD
jgi:hypothetical protein